MLQQWKAQISIPPTSGINYKQRMLLREISKGIIKNSHIPFQVIHKQGTTAGGLSKVLTDLPLKWLTDKMCMDRTMTFEIRKIIGTRTAGTGAAKRSIY